MNKKTLSSTALVAAALALTAAPALAGDNDTLFRIESLDEATNTLSVFEVTFGDGDQTGNSWTCFSACPVAISLSVPRTPLDESGVRLPEIRGAVKASARSPTKREKILGLNIRSMFGRPGFWASEAGLRLFRPTTSEISDFAHPDCGIRPGLGMLSRSRPRAPPRVNGESAPWVG